MFVCWQWLMRFTASFVALSCNLRFCVASIVMLFLPSSRLVSFSGYSLSVFFPSLIASL